MANFPGYVPNIQVAMSNPCGEIPLRDSNTEHLAKITLRKLEQVKNSSGRLRNFFGILNKVEKKSLAVCGGAVRDWWFLRDPKDIDLVVDCPEKVIHMLASNFKHRKSQFNGYVFDVGGIKIDIWRLQDSWAFTQNPLMEKTWGNLLYSFPFDIDSVLVFADGSVKENGFFDSLNRREIELVNPINKNPVTNIVQRAVRFKEKYGFRFGPKLQAEVDRHCNKSGIDYDKLFKEIQQRAVASGESSN